jgi:hypothetical protein
MNVLVKRLEAIQGNMVAVLNKFNFVMVVSVDSQRYVCV